MPYRSGSRIDHLNLAVPDLVAAVRFYDPVLASIGIVLAGVSRSTVSRVLNGGDRVSPQAHAAVAKAIEQVGWTAGHAARSLALGRSDTVFFLLTEPQRRLFEDPTFSELLRGCTEELARQGMLLSLVTADSLDQSQRAVGYLGGQHVGGVLLVSNHLGDPIVNDLLDARVPVVLCGHFPEFESQVSMEGGEAVTVTLPTTLIERGSSLARALS